MCLCVGSLGDHQVQVLRIEDGSESILVLAARIYCYSMYVVCAPTNDGNPRSQLPCPWQERRRRFPCMIQLIPRYGPNHPSTHSPAHTSTRKGAAFGFLRAGGKQQTRR
eukprot:scaffold14198_cov124-Isochrysis_galbana.AAC.1